jgi:hypothetical protein
MEFLETFFPEMTFWLCICTRICNYERTEEVKLATIEYAAF